MNEYRFAELREGQKESFTREITPEMEDMFRAVSGDENPLHRDDAFAREIGEGKFPGHVTFGMLTASLYSTMAGMYLPGRYSLIHSLEIKFQNPVFSGDLLTVEGTVKKKHDGLNLIELAVRITNQNQKCVSKADMKVMVLR